MPTEVELATADQSFEVETVLIECLLRRRATASLVRIKMSRNNRNGRGTRIVLYR